MDSEITYREIFSDSKYADHEVTKTNGDIRIDHWYYHVTLYSPKSYYKPFLVKAEFGRSGDEDNNTSWSVMDNTNEPLAIRSVIKDIDGYTFPFTVMVAAKG